MKDVCLERGKYSSGSGTEDAKLGMERALRERQRASTRKPRLGNFEGGWNDYFCVTGILMWVTVVDYTGVVRTPS